MRWKIQAAEFVRAITRSADAPETRPAVAFAGRSNVGKSSLLNRLLGGRKLARTSSTPGCTRQVVYFEIDRRFHFIDLPGYGYAKAPKHEMAKWGAMMERFFHTAEGLRLTVLLVDVRRDPTPEDLRMIDWLEAGERPYIFAVTKCDKVGRGERMRRLMALQSAFGLPDMDSLVPVSARTGDGVDDLLGVIREALEADSSKA